MILNCLCRQCRLSGGRNSIYRAHNKSVRRTVNQKVNYYVTHKILDFDLPVKFKGIFAS